MRNLQSRRADVKRIEAALDCVGPVASDLEATIYGPAGLTVTMDPDVLFYVLDEMLEDARKKLAVEELVGSEGAP